MPDSYHNSLQNTSKRTAHVVICYLSSTKLSLFERTKPPRDFRLQEIVCKTFFLSDFLHVYRSFLFFYPFGKHKPTKPSRVNPPNNKLGTVMLLILSWRTDWTNGPIFTWKAFSSRSVGNERWTRSKSRQQQGKSIYFSLHCLCTHGTFFTNTSPQWLTKYL